jgi:hypothetical protein
MNNKLLLQDLTDQLAEAGKIKKKDAEERLRAATRAALAAPVTGTSFQEEAAGSGILKAIASPPPAPPAPRAACS